MILFFISKIANVEIILFAGSSVSLIKVSMSSGFSVSASMIFVLSLFKFRIDLSFLRIFGKCLICNSFKISSLFSINFAPFLIKAWQPLETGEWMLPGRANNFYRVSAYCIHDRNQRPGSSPGFNNERAKR
jgi:hypothetical protein